MIFTTKPEGMDEKTWQQMLAAQDKSGLMGASRDQKEAALRLHQAQQLRAPEGRHWTRQATRALQGGMSGYLNKKALDLQNAANQKQQEFVRQLRGAYEQGGAPAAPAPGGMFPGAGGEGAPLMGPSGIPLEGAGAIAPPPAAPGGDLMGPGGSPLMEPGAAPAAGPGVNWAALGSKLGSALGGGQRQQAPFRPSNVKVKRYDENGNPITDEEEGIYG